MNKFKRLSKAFGSTEHWYIRLLQWPVILLFYSVMIILVPCMIAFVALTWPFYNWYRRDI